MASASCSDRANAEMGRPMISVGSWFPAEAEHGIIDIGNVSTEIADGDGVDGRIDGMVLDPQLFNGLLRAGYIYEGTHGAQGLAICVANKSWPTGGR